MYGTDNLVYCTYSANYALLYTVLHCAVLTMSERQVLSLTYDLRWMKLQTTNSEKEIDELKVSLQLNTKNSSQVNPIADLSLSRVIDVMTRFQVGSLKRRLESLQLFHVVLQFHMFIFHILNSIFLNVKKLATIVSSNE